MAVVADECKPVSVFSVEISRSFSYLEISPPPAVSNIIRFARPKIVVVREASAVNPDEIVAKWDKAGRFADQGGPKMIPVDALPG